MNLFAYGSLAIPEVLQALTGKVFSAQPARLSGYRRFSLQERIYPGIIPYKGGWTDGQLFTDLDASSAQLVASFEDSIYSPRTVTVYTDRGESHDATSYVVDLPSYGILVDTDWSVDVFKDSHLAAYIDMCLEFRRRFWANSASPS